MIHSRRRWRNTNVELQDTLFFRVVSHGICTDRGFVHFRLQIPKIEFVPVLSVLVLNIDGRPLHLVRRDFQLHIPTGTEIHVGALRKLQVQLFNHRGDVIVRDHFALPTLDTQSIFRHFYFEVLLYRDLTREAPIFVDFTTRKVALFSG